MGNGRLAYETNEARGAVACRVESSWKEGVDGLEKYRERAAGAHSDLEAQAHRTGNRGRVGISKLARPAWRVISWKHHMDDVSWTHWAGRVKQASA